MNLNGIRNFFLSQPYCERKYLNRYLNFISKHREFGEDNLTQTHHIIPRWLGGSDSYENLITLTVKEHIHAHKILYYMLKSKESFYSVIVFSKLRNVESGVRKKTVVNVSKEQFSNFQSTLTKKTRWMTNGEADKRIHKSEIVDYLLDGWELGRSNKSIKGMIMCYDLFEEKNVKIPKEEYENNRKRFNKKTHIPVWDIENQPDFPFVTLTGVSKEEYEQNKQKYRTSSDLVVLETGERIHKDYFDSSIHKKKQETREGARSHGIYITPLGNYQNCHKAAKDIGISPETVINWTKRLDKPLSPKSLKNDFVFLGMKKEELVNKTPRELGFDFIPKSSCFRSDNGDLLPI